MPEYSYVCDPQRGGCGHLFSVVQSFSEYKPLKRCPSCNKHKLIRDYGADNVTGTVKGSGGANTLGHLAEVNSGRLSSDQKESLRKKHNKYRDNPDSIPVKGERIKKNQEKPWYRTKNDVANMTETQQKNYIRTGKKNG